MSVPYSLLIIKPLSIGRGQGPEILSSILNSCPVALRMFRAWSPCETTLLALTTTQDGVESNLNYDVEKMHPRRYVDNWICIFTHFDRSTDPTDLLNQYCGPLDPQKWLPEHLRYQYGGFTKLGKAAHGSDTVVHIALPERVNYEANILFMKFDESNI